MQLEQILMYAGLGLMAFFILRKATRTIVRVVLIVVVIAFVWSLYTGGKFGQFAISQTEKVDEMIRERNIKKVFGDTPIAELRELCDEDYEDSRCACFVKPVVADLDERLGKSGIRKLRNDKDKRLEEIKTSMYNQRKDIRACLARKKGVQMLRWFEEIIDPSVAENN